MKIVCDECARLFRYEEPFGHHAVSTEPCPDGAGCPFKLRIARLLINHIAPEGYEDETGFHYGKPPVKKEVIQSR